MESEPSVRGSRAVALTARDPYVDVGRALRSSIASFLEGTRDRRTRVFLAVLYLTASYSRITDRVYVAQIAELAAIPGDTAADGYRHTRRALKELHDHGSIVWASSRGRGKQSSVSLIVQGEKTGPLLAMVSEQKTGPVRDAKPGRSELEKPGQLELENRAASGPPTEKRSEKMFRASSYDDEFEKLIKPLGWASPSQLREWDAGYGESPFGFRRCVRQVESAEKPPAVLTDMIRDGAHLLPPTDQDLIYEAAEAEQRGEGDFLTILHRLYAEQSELWDD